MGWRDDLVGSTMDRSRYLRSPGTPRPARWRRIRRPLYLLAAVTVMGILVAGQNGLLTYLALKRTLARRLAERDALATQVAELERERRWIQEDPDALPHIARREYGFAPEGSIVFDFSEEASPPLIAPPDS